MRAGGGAALIAVVLTAGCGGGHAAPGQTTIPGPAAPSSSLGGSLVRAPRPDYADAASEAAAFYVAWAIADAVHDGPDACVARCAPLVTKARQRQLAASQPATAAWQAMRHDRMVSLDGVRAVTRPACAPAACAAVMYLRVYATRVTFTTAGRTTGSGGITLQPTRAAGRWLVSAVLFYLGGPS